jgi:hypothetical protein
LIAVVVLLFSASLCFAQIEQIRAKVVNGNCTICFKTAQVGLQAQVNGIGEVKGDSDAQTYELTFKAATVPLKNLLTQIKSANPNGTVQVQITASGRVDAKQNQFVLAVPNQSETLWIDAGTRIQSIMSFSQSSHTIRLSGDLTEANNGFKVTVTRLQKID